MSKLIDADALKRKFSYSGADTEDEKIWTTTMRRMIDDMPAADVEPLKYDGEYIRKDDAIEAVRHAWAKGLEPTQYIEILPTADVEPVSTWKERVNKALTEIKEIRLCDILHGHGACGGCGDDDWVCIAQKIEDIVSKMDGGSE